MAKDRKKYNTTIPKEALKPYFSINNVNYTIVSTNVSGEVEINNDKGEVFSYDWDELKEKQDKYC